MCLQLFTKKIYSLMLPNVIAVPRLCKRHLHRFLKQQFRHCVADHTSVDSPVPHVCVVGSGPAGFYTAQQLLKGNPDIVVDIYEKLPVPFGLVRFGVAPDHPEVKNVINTFTKTAKSERCSFIGNVEVGRDITLQQLRDAYSAVVLAYGADNDKTLGIPGEGLDNVLSARSFVGWFNGLPQDRDLKVDLSAERAVILGHGNVAVDVARILLTPIDILKTTDISQHALEALSHSCIKGVVLVGRRGPLQVAFTIKELREMTKIPECRPHLNPKDYLELLDLIPDLPRPRSRLTDLLYKTALEPNARYKALWADAKREWKLQFLRSPIHICGETKVTGIKLAINRLEVCLHTVRKQLLKGSNILPKGTRIDLIRMEHCPYRGRRTYTCIYVDRDNPDKNGALSLQRKENIHFFKPIFTFICLCPLVYQVLRSIGYRSVSIDKDIPFNMERGVVSHTQGRVDGLIGVYCSGWVNTGPVGVILTTMTNGFETGKTIIHDISNGTLELSGKQGKNDILPLLQKSGVQVVSFSDWMKIDEAEVERGQNCGKPREKLVDIDAMLKIASTAAPSPL
ncbi:NADPH:adrenodoxin oxidoreductase, mitochondrial-like [Mizuhopecten yessoensis]|uniref:NADPH:adrenodoxin oxidoreductase, mitochondrial-like n=1 Tax=Mizuhopecten yessoensis TaxID=6573 RepID=UPI000B45BF59|nr:NADPH:adrenodoxin oxidoreductase, mitochondrial-like [Mizuhopecten yessoensis]